MWSFAIPELWSAEARETRERGATLAELLVVLVVISVLAVAALPMAETTVQRRQEIELRETLRTVRTAIDRFHADWRSGAIAEGADGVSENGFPEELVVLVEGVEASEDERPKLRYLRRLPTNPFSSANTPLSDHWRFFGYAQDPDSTRWDGKDIYDIRPATQETALDGSGISDW